MSPGAAGDWIGLGVESSGNTTLLDGVDGRIADYGTGNVTTMAGDHQVGEFYGSGGTIVSTGRGNHLILTGTQSVTVTGEDTGIGNMGDNIAVTLSDAGDTMNMTGSGNTTTVTGDHITVGSRHGQHHRALLRAGHRLRPALVCAIRPGLGHVGNRPAAEPHGR